MLRVFLIFTISTLVFNFGFSQNQFWKDIKEEQIVNKTDKKRYTFPDKARILKLDFESIKEELLKSPNKFVKSESDLYKIVSLPMPNGSVESFQIQEASIMEPKLAKQFPNIKTYSGFGLDDNALRLKITTGSDGFHAQILSNTDPSVYIDPYFFKDKEYYMSYYKKDLNPNGQNFVCHFDDLKENQLMVDGPSEKATGDCTFRTYRLACAATGEYTSFHGGTVGDGMNAINTSMARVNGIYEQEVAVTMVLVGNNSSIVYTNGSTDPYTNGNGGAMLGENQTNCDNVIGSANYDIGHVFSTGGGGVAQLNAPCGSGKARGVTGQSTPVGDPFDVDYVAHEMGHQYGARHTFNNSCGGNRSTSSSYEPGSGSTIMAYAGICNPNVQNNSDDYFHAKSLQDIKSFVGGSGNSCAVTSSSGNTAPTVDGGPDYTIPISTYFFLEASGDDIDVGDDLTYCWEQWDRQVANMPPESTSTTGPLFRTLKGVSSNRRYFPALNHVLNGTSTDWEVLPSVSRDMNFRVTIRDNAPIGGCTDEDNVTISSTATAGPFKVTSSTMPEEWAVGSMQTITWDVANTNLAPVLSLNVDILLSKDDGLTYPVVLADDVPNIGSFILTVPDEPTNIGRIMVKGADNVFYDINAARIGIDMPPKPEYCKATYNNASCSSGDYIDDVIIEDINNVANDCALDVNFSDFTAMSTVVEVDETYNLNAKVCPDYDQYVVVFVDFNVDGDFLDPGEFFDLGFVDKGTSSNVNVVIPSNAVLGETVLRVMCQFGNNPINQGEVCDNFDYGEVEDYTILIEDPCPDNRTITTNYNGQTEDIEAGISITATNEIIQSSDITYDAGMEILLDNDFFVDTKSMFYAFIDGCGNLVKEEVKDEKN